MYAHLCCIAESRLIADINIYTPVVVDTLLSYLRGYHDKTFVVDGFRNGFSLSLCKSPKLRSTNKIFPPKKELVKKIGEEVNKKRIIGPFTCPPLKNLMISPVTVIPKPDSKKFRMIFNLSQPRGKSVNDNIPREKRSVTYCTVRQVVQWMMQEDEDWWMAKVDLTDAYRMVPINKQEWRFLGMRVGRKIYIDRCLPMGAASSCALFQRISDAITWMATSSCPTFVRIFNYLDDFLLVAKGKENCQKALEHFVQRCETTGIPLSNEKTVEPTQRLTFLGLGIDVAEKVLFIPQRRQKNPY